MEENDLFKLNITPEKQAQMTFINSEHNAAKLNVLMELMIQLIASQSDDDISLIRQDVQKRLDDQVNQGMQRLIQKGY